MQACGSSGRPMTSRLFTRRQQLPCVCAHKRGKYDSVIRDLDRPTQQKGAAQGRTERQNLVEPLRRRQDGVSLVYESSLAYAAQRQGSARGRSTRQSRTTPAGRARKEDGAARPGKPRMGPGTARDTTRRHDNPVKKHKELLDT